MALLHPQSNFLIYLTGLEKEFIEVKMQHNTKSPTLSRHYHPISSSPHPSTPYPSPILPPLPIAAWELEFFTQRKCYQLMSKRDGAGNLHQSLSYGWHWVHISSSTQQQQEIRQGHMSELHLQEPPTPHLPFVTSIEISDILPFFPLIYIYIYIYISRHT